MNKIILDEKYKIIALKKDESVELNEYDGWFFTNSYSGKETKLMFFEKDNEK